MQAAAQEYQREFAAKDAAIQALNGEVEALQDLLHSQLEDARSAARVSITTAPNYSCKVLWPLVNGKMEALQDLLRSAAGGRAVPPP